LGIPWVGKSGGGYGEWEWALPGILDNKLVESAVSGVDFVGGGHFGEIGDYEIGACDGFTERFLRGIRGNFREYAYEFEFDDFLGLLSNSVTLFKGAE
jgi:hypothetical protein